MEPLTPASAAGSVEQDALSNSDCVANGDDADAAAHDSSSNAGEAQDTDADAKATDALSPTAAGRKSETRLTVSPGTGSKRLSAPVGDATASRAPAKSTGAVGKPKAPAKKGEKATKFASMLAEKSAEPVPADKPPAKRVHQALPA